VRGHSPEEMIIDHPLLKDNGNEQEAITHFRTLAYTEIDLPFGKHSTSRYSLVQASPQTGRMHQLRKHFAHINHPIIGDRPHGCNKQNKFFKTNWQMDTMLLHASSLSFAHPINKQWVNYLARPQPEFLRMCQLMGFKL